MKRWWWLGLIILIGLVSLRLSMGAYKLSQAKQEVLIAETEVGHNNLPATATMPQAGELRLYYWNVPTSRGITRKFLIKHNGITKTFLINSGEFKDTGIQVVAGDTIELTAMEGVNYSKQAYGWLSSANDACAGYDVAKQLNSVRDRQQPLAGAQCWCDWDTISNDESDDCNDYLSVVSYQSNVIPASPTPQPSANPNPSSSPSPSTSQAGFVIHKFLDVNKNGVRETGEGQTNRAWEFEYQVNGGEKRTYLIDPGADAGDKITVNQGDKVKVQELGQEGWLNTTGSLVEKTIFDNKTYDFYFGNWPVNGVPGPAAVPGAAVPYQPKTGTPTWLTLGALSLVLGASIYYAIKKISILVR